MALSNKKILLGVCGSIAAYKAAHLVRLLVKEGAHVQVIMTPDASAFITPLTLSTLSGNPVHIAHYTSDGNWNNHVALALWADALVLAPATANTLAKMAHGTCDNLLTAVILSARCPVYAAPAMDVDMWHHAATQHNVSLLRSRGVQLINPAYGALASGLEGEGRMPEPDQIVRLLDAELCSSTVWAGKKVLVTAGPTYEPIDPVRFIGNFSTGTMGFAIAEACAQRGAQVVLVTGPTFLTTNHPSIVVHSVTTAEQMKEMCLQHFPNAQLTIMSAAVADYSPDVVHTQKIKKQSETWQITCRKTPDILALLGAQKTTEQFLVGFALETHDALVHAKQKIHAKNLDLVVLNSLQDEGAGFGITTNKVTIIDRENNEVAYALKDKKQVAADLLAYVEAHFLSKTRLPS